MSDLWAQHLAARNAELECDVQRLRALVCKQRRRAEMWRKRALDRNGDLLHELRRLRCRVDALTAVKR